MKNNQICYDWDTPLFYQINKNNLFNYNIKVKLL